jgi:hypothetical protein
MPDIRHSEKVFGISKLSNMKRTMNHQKIKKLSMRQGTAFPFIDVSIRFSACLWMLFGNRNNVLYGKMYMNNTYYKSVFISISLFYNLLNNLKINTIFFL